MAQVTMTGQEYVELMEEMRGLRAIQEFMEEWLVPNVKDGYFRIIKDMDNETSESKAGKLYTVMVTEIFIGNVLKNPEVCSRLIKDNRFGFNPITMELNGWYSWNMEDVYKVDLRKHDRWDEIVKLAEDYDKAEEEEAVAELAATEALEAMEAMEQEHDDVLSEAATTQEDEDEEE